MLTATVDLVSCWARFHAVVSSTLKKRSDFLSLGHQAVEGFLG